MRHYRALVVCQLILVVPGQTFFILGPYWSVLNKIYNEDYIIFILFETFMVDFSRGGHGRFESHPCQRIRIFFGCFRLSTYEVARKVLRFFSA